MRWESSRQAWCDSKGCAATTFLRKRSLCVQGSFAKESSQSSEMAQSGWARPFGKRQCMFAGLLCKRDCTIWRADSEMCKPLVQKLLSSLVSWFSVVTRDVKDQGAVSPPKEPYKNTFYSCSVLIYTFTITSEYTHKHTTVFTYSFFFFLQKGLLWIIVATCHVRNYCAVSFANVLWGSFPNVL